MNASLQQTLDEMGFRARAASRLLAGLSTARKNSALLAIAKELEIRTRQILAANAEDVARAESHGLSPAMVDRLRLSDKRIAKMAAEVRNVSELPDPVGKHLVRWTRPNGIEITKIRVPIGVIGIIYESRPNVTCDAAVLCLKTGNATILRGGSEAFSSNQAIIEALGAGLIESGLPVDAVQLVPTTDREAVEILAKMDQSIDMIVPRGGHALIEKVVTAARMPVVKHYHGVCHVYVEKEADLGMAVEVTVNGKCQRPGVCNAVETLLVDKEIAPRFLPRLAKALEAHQVELRGDDAARDILGDDCKPASEEDWTAEYLDLILSIRVVPGIETAIDHINSYGSHHSDAIITEDTVMAERFLSEVDSATVYWNASTRFTDGAEFGFGAEIGISTDKLHARGPMGLEELTTYKYQIRGEGQVKG